MCQRGCFTGQAEWEWERPITLTGCLYAIYMAGCKNEMRSWDSEHHGWWDEAVKGNSALQSGLLRRVYQEVASLNGQSAACVFFDMEKFYDSACLYKLIDLAMARDFPRRLLYVAMQAYLSDRIIERSYGGAKHTALKRNFGWLLVGEQICEGHLLQDIGQREQRPASATASAIGDAPVCG